MFDEETMIKIIKMLLKRNAELEKENQAIEEEEDEAI